VQGTNNWVFDKRNASGNDECLMLLDESMVSTGLFAYRALTSLAVRNDITISNESMTDISIEKDEIIAVDFVRESPFNAEFNGPFLHLTDGSGWLFEKKQEERVMERVTVQEGKWKLKVVNAFGIAPLRQPIDRLEMQGFSFYECNKMIDCDQKINSISGVTFYRVTGTDGWVLDRRGDHAMLAIEASTAASVGIGTFLGNAWTPDFVRGVAAAIDGLHEIAFNQYSRVISFRNIDGARINVYYTTRTIGTALDHPRQGRTQMFRRCCSASDLLEILQNPRAHTGRGYQQKRSRLSTVEDDAIVQTEHGPGVVVDSEEVLRDMLLSTEDELAQLTKKRKEMIKRLKAFDENRGKLVATMKQKFQYFEQQRAEARAQAEAQARAEAEAQARAQAEAQARAEAEAQARAVRLRLIAERTCERCNREFSNAHAREQHWNAVHKFSCRRCDRDFHNSHALYQHQNAKYHW
jgi:hypothetical protein